MYLAEVWKLATTCDWTEAHLTENLQDKFVMGLHNECLLQQLLTQDHKKPLDDLFQLAIILEATEMESFRQAKDSSDRNTAASSVTPVNSSKRKTVQQSHRKQPAQSGEQSNVQVVVETIFVALVDSEVQNFISVIN